MLKNKKTYLEVKDIMTTKVISVLPETPVSNILKVLAKHNGLPVIDEQNKLVGIITQYDLIEKKTDCENKNILVKDIMNFNPITFKENVKLEEARQIFSEYHKVNPVPVVNENSQVIGIVSRYDILQPKYLIEWKNFLRRSFFSSQGDIERPYHKIINLLLKTIGIGFMLLGLWFFYSAAEKYFTEYYSFIIQEKEISVQVKENLFEEINSISLLGITSLLLGLCVSSVLVLRYVAFTLPDRIYFRNYASREEKKARRRGYK